MDKAYDQKLYLYCENNGHEASVSWLLGTAVFVTSDYAMQAPIIERVVPMARARDGSALDINTPANEWFYSARCIHC